MASSSCTNSGTVTEYHGESTDISASGHTDEKDYENRKALAYFNTIAEAITTALKLNT